MLQPSQYVKGDIVALDRAYIDYEKFETLTKNGVTYVTKLKKNLKYTVQKDIMYMNEEGMMTYREQYVTFTKEENKKKSSLTRFFGDFFDFFQKSTFFEYLVLILHL